MKNIVVDRKIPIPATHISRIISFIANTDPKAKRGKISPENINNILRLLNLDKIMPLIGLNIAFTNGITETIDPASPKVIFLTSL